MTAGNATIMFDHVKWTLYLFVCEIAVDFSKPIPWRKPDNNITSESLHTTLIKIYNGFWTFHFQLAPKREKIERILPQVMKNWYWCVCWRVYTLQLHKVNKIDLQIQFANWLHDCKLSVTMYSISLTYHHLTDRVISFFFLSIKLCFFCLQIEFSSYCFGFRRRKAYFSIVLSVNERCL